MLLIVGRSGVLNTSGLFFIYWNNAFYDVLSDFESTLDSKENGSWILMRASFFHQGEKNL